MKTLNPARARDYEVPSDASWTKMMPGESTLNFVYFQRFLGMPDDRRSYANVAKSLKLSCGTITNLGAKFKWVLRLAAYQSWVAQCETRDAIKLGERTRAAEARVAEKAFRFLEKQIDLHLSDRSDEAAMPFSAVIQAVESLGRFSRVGRGEPSEHKVTEKKESMDNLLAKLRDYSKARPTKQPEDIEINVSPPPQQPHDPRNQSGL